MKKFFILLFCVLSLGIFSQNAFAEEAETITLKGETTFNWVDMSQIDRDSLIQNYKEVLFGEGTVQKYKKKEFRGLYKDFIKDARYQSHYLETQNGITETRDYRLSGFFKGNLLISYAVQYKDKPTSVYYYNAFGRLIYVDMISENYPNFPYFSKQYKANGELASAIYFVSHDLQYIYQPNGEFKGVWYLNKMYDKNAKQILTRSNW